MRSPIGIDHKHSRAIGQEVGERMQAYLRVEPELPASLRKRVDQLRELEGQSPSIVPDMGHGYKRRSGRMSQLVTRVILAAREAISDLS